MINRASVSDAVAFAALREESLHLKSGVASWDDYYSRIAPYVASADASIRDSAIERICMAVFRAEPMSARQVKGRVFDCPAAMASPRIRKRVESLSRCTPRFSLADALSRRRRALYRPVGRMARRMARRGGRSAPEAVDSRCLDPPRSTRGGGSARVDYATGR